MKRLTLSHDEIATLCLELSLFLHSGVDAGSGLSLLAQEETSAPHKALLEQMAAGMDEGASLDFVFSDAGCFPDYVCNLIRVGEQTGRTEEALRALAQYYEQRSRLDRRLRSALLYPSVLMLIMLAVIVVLLTKVLPVFSQVYASLGGQLTGVAGGLLALGQLLDGAMPILALLLVAVVLFLGAFTGLPAFRERILSRWQKQFGDKGVSKKLSTARFAQSLAMALSSGLPVEEALSLAASLQNDSPAAKARCQSCLDKLYDGISLAQAMGDTGLLPRAECRLLELGMRSGSGEEVMDHIAQRLSEEGDAALETRMGQIEPTLVMISSVLVGMILLSVMLPLMNIMTAIG